MAVPLVLLELCENIRSWHDLQFFPGNVEITEMVQWMMPVSESKGGRAASVFVLAESDATSSCQEIPGDDQGARAYDEDLRDGVNGGAHV